MSDTSARSRRESALAVGFLLIGLVVWLWPIGFGGRMPVGGDVTQFSIGLMAFLSRAIRAFRLPVWNDLWGYGFPGLAESQMGVYYPPHWLLYGLLPLEWAYTASLVIHTLLGGMGTYWCSRRFDVSPTGSALSGFAWATSGFFVIHLPHQWGYTVACWMPWAWGLAWLIAQGRGSRRTACLLAMVLSLQILPGHFQLAFSTEVGVLLLTLGGSPWTRAGRRGALGVWSAMLAVAPLAALQLIPTLRLAVLAAGRRDYEYLSGFAASPLHLVSYVAPGLFQRSPLWRPLAWDPFRTSPEEHLAYVGLVPLFLALGMIVRKVRKEPAVRALALVALATLVFSLGPYVPGFEVWSRLPGFSFFRAPARWSVATGLALCLLAGMGFDALRGWPRPGKALAWFAIAAAMLPAMVVLAVELALASTEATGMPAVAGAYDRVLNLLPWSRVLGPRDGTDPGRGSGAPAPTIRALTNLARQPQDDPQLRVRSGLARQGIAWQAGTRTFTKSRFSIYRQELGETALLIAGLIAVAPLARHRRGAFAAALIVLTAIDLWLVGHHRRIDVGPIRPLKEQSAVLARLSRMSRGSRTVDSARNLPMVADAAPIASYRTLDLPCMTSLNALALSPLGRPETAAALRSAGAAVRVLDPFETSLSDRSAGPLPGWTTRETLSDRALAGWLYGTDLVEQQGASASTFTLLTPGTAPGHAWLVPLTDEREATILVVRTGQVDALLDTLRTATPLVTLRSRPERLEVQVQVQAPGPSLVIVSQLADPQWRARWVGAGGEREATILPAFAGRQEYGWQAIETPGPGRWTLVLEYDARDVRFGLGVSLVSWAVWAAAFLRFGRSDSHSRGNPS